MRFSGILAFYTMALLVVPVSLSAAAPDDSLQNLEKNRHGVSLQVTPLSSGGMTTSQATITNVSVIQKLKIRVQNIGHESEDLTAHWYFFSRPTTSRQLSCYDKSEKAFTVPAGGWNEFVVKSTELQTINVSRFTPGIRTEGWIVVVKLGGRIVDFKAANSSLEELLKDPDEFAKVLAAPVNTGTGAAPAAATVAAASATPQSSPSPDTAAGGIIHSIKGLIFGKPTP